MKRTVLTSLLPAVTLFAVAQTQVIAHRGFWKTEGSAQNSIASLVKADSIGCYGCEFDVWLTADNELVVNHDSHYKLRRIESIDAAELTALSLKNGETLPALRAYLTAARGLSTRLVLELKAHSAPARETIAVEKIVDMVKELALEDRMEYISFSLHAVREFIRLTPAETPVYYLNGDLAPAELKETGCAGPDYQQSVYRKHPEWIAACRELELKVNVWTVNNAGDMQWFIEQGADFITTDEPLLLQELLREAPATER